MRKAEDSVSADHIAWLRRSGVLRFLGFSFSVFFKGSLVDFSICACRVQGLGF